MSVRSKKAVKDLTINNFILSLKCLIPILQYKSNMNSAVKATTVSFIIALLSGGVEATRIHSAAEIMARSHAQVEWGIDWGGFQQKI